MPTYTQDNLLMRVNTPLGPDALLLRSFSAYEAISQLFNFQLDLWAENRTAVPFDQLLGQKVCVEMALPDGSKRYFNGIVCRIGAGDRGEIFTDYRVELVPQFWMLTRRSQSRIFQHQTVPDILKKVLEGLDVAYQIQGTWQPRNYCVQYRETDFNFACRIMEEEGICYFFKHSANGHQMVLANTPPAHPAVPGPAKIRYMKTINYKSDEDGVGAWEKVQEVRPGKYTLWDHCFELPHQHLEANKPVKDSVPVGTVTHKLKVGGNDKLEVYDWPGAYAQRFDGIDKGGGERPADLQKIYEDNARTVAIRMQQDSESQSFAIRGASNCRHFVPGHKFTLERHYNADGEYVLTEVSHSANQEVIYRSTLEAVAGFSYENHFKCIPAGVHYAPPRLTAKPVVHGTQTAVVVGPPGEEIYPDKYGRVKIQFHWDRQGKNDADSSCWCRVAQPWAGQNWGMISLPRIGQEVVIDFLEGDPDHPIIIGSVYNADQMPPYSLPANKTQSGVKSRSSLGGSPSNYNEIRFEDKKGSEQINVHAEKDMATTVEHDDTQHVMNNRTITVDGTHTETIKKDTTIKITEGKLVHDVMDNTADYHVMKAVTEVFEANQSTTVTQQIEVSSVKNGIYITADNKEIRLRSGESMLLMKKDGTIQLHGVNIEIIGTTEVKNGVGTQTVTLDKQQVATAGAKINSSAVGLHEISGALIKIN
jgi:type VI secretion system secreted protein VgrG